MDNVKSKGKLGILIPGMGAVASTLIAGVEAIKSNKSKPIGSMSQMGTIRLGKRTENRVPLIKDFAPLADLEDLVFGGWDINDENLYEICIRNGVLEKSSVDEMKTYLKTTGWWEGAWVASRVACAACRGLGRLGPHTGIEGSEERHR